MAPWSMRATSRVACLVALLTCWLEPAVLRAADDGEVDCRIATPDTPVEPMTLRVALYPFTPDRLVLFQKLESAFECRHAGVNVVLISTPNATDDYYKDDDVNKKGFQFVDADVYEIDTILLAEFMGKIAPIELPYQDFAPEGIQAVTRDGKIYGVPHWLCGNFLFYRKSDVQIKNARSWEDLSDILASRNQGLLVDFKGRSTLGEWYLTALSSKVGLDAAQKQVTAGAPLDKDAVIHLQNILAACPPGYCRSQKLHDNTGFYARAFVRGQAGVYIGYSETIHYGLRGAAENCLPSSDCLNEDDIAVRALPPFDPTKKETGVGWVDALAIDAKLAGRKKELAIEFIKFAVSDASYQSMLQPEGRFKSRYLLPARPDVPIAKAPLYTQFFSAHSGRGTGTLPHLNKKLREMADKVTCNLAIDRDDSDTMQACIRN